MVDEPPARRPLVPCFAFRRERRGNTRRHRVVKSRGANANRAASTPVGDSVGEALRRLFLPAHVAVASSPQRGRAGQVGVAPWVVFWAKPANNKQQIMRFRVGLRPGRPAGCDARGSSGLSFRGVSRVSCKANRAARTLTRTPPPPPLFPPTLADSWALLGMTSGAADGNIRSCALPAGSGPAATVPPPPVPACAFRLLTSCLPPRPAPRTVSPVYFTLVCLPGGRRSCRLKVLRGPRPTSARDGRGKGELG